MLFLLLKHHLWQLANQADYPIISQNITSYHGKAEAIIAENRADIIYLDPMFNQPRQKASVKKN